MLGIIQEIEARERYYEETIALLREEVEHWKRKHWEEVDRSIRHSEGMMGELILAACRGALGSPQADDAVAGTVDQPQADHSRKEI